MASVTHTEFDFVLYGERGLLAFEIKRTARVRDEDLDPLSPSGSQRVLRGGSWIIVPALCRSAFRFAGDPGLASLDVGFRPALLARSSSK